MTADDVDAEPVIIETVTTVATRIRPPPYALYLSAIAAVITIYLFLRR
jgi:hypothetical protein